jgi:hypothetical protein
MEKDQRDLLREFNAHNVRYLVVGGYAFSHYTQPRATKDLDVFIENSAENAARVFAALAKFGAPVAGMSPKDFQDNDSVYQVGVAPSRIDILQTIEAIEFAAAWEASEEGMTGDGILVRYISFDDLIRNKLAVGRLRDLADVEDLRESKAAISRSIKSNTPSEP